MKISNDDQQYGYKDKNTNTSRSSSCSIDDSSSSSSASSSSQQSTAPKFTGSSTNAIATPSRSETLKKQSADQVITPSTSVIQSEPLVDSSRQQQLHKGSMPLASNKNHDVRITTKFQGEKDDVEREAQEKGHEKIVSRTSEAGITSSTISISSSNHTRAVLTNLEEEEGRQGGASTNTAEEIHQNCPSSPRKHSTNATLLDEEEQQQQTRKPSCDSSSGGIDQPETSYVDRAEESHLPASRGEQDLISFYLNGQVVGPFPLKLQTMLRLAEKLGMQDIIGWQPHGRSFCIRNPARFEAGLMKRFFKQKELASFRRQLNLYDFKRIKYGPDSGSYYHEMFLRGKPFHAYKMIRTKVKGTGGAVGNSSNRHDNENEPNFYRMPFLPPCLNEYIASVSTDGSNSDTVAASLAAVGFGDVTAGTVGGGQTLMIPSSGVMSAPQQVGSDVFNAASSILSDHVRNQQHARQQQGQQQQQQTISNAANLLPFFNVGLNQTFPSNVVNNINLYTSTLTGQSQSHPAPTFLSPESLLQHRNTLVNSDLRSYFLGGAATGTGAANLQPNSNIANILDMMLTYNQGPNIPSTLSPIGHAMNNDCSNTNAGQVTSNLVGQMAFLSGSSNNPMNFPNNLNASTNDLLNLYNQLQYNNLNARDRAWLEEGLASSMIMGNSNHVRMPGNNAVDPSHNNSRDLFSNHNYNPALDPSSRLGFSGGDTNQQIVGPNLGFFLGTQMQAHGNTSQNTMANNLSASTVANNASTTNPTIERAAIHRHHQTTMQSESNIRIPPATEQIENPNKPDHRTGN